MVYMDRNEVTKLEMSKSAEKLLGKLELPVMFDVMVEIAHKLCPNPSVVVTTEHKRVFCHPDFYSVETPNQTSLSNFS